MKVLLLFQLTETLYFVMLQHLSGLKCKARTSALNFYPQETFLSFSHDDDDDAIFFLHDCTRSTVVSKWMQDQIDFDLGFTWAFLQKTGNSPSGFTGKGAIRPSHAMASSAFIIIWFQRAQALWDMVAFVHSSHLPMSMPRSTVPH